MFLKTDDCDIIFAGGTSYNQEQVLKAEIAGVNQDFRKTKATYKKLLLYASRYPTIYLPTHDGQAGQRPLDKLGLAGDVLLSPIIQVL